MAGLTDKKRAELVEEASVALLEGETVLDATRGIAHVRRVGRKTIRAATILVTDRRIIIFSKKAGGYDVADFALGLLTGIDHKKGMGSGSLTIRAAGDAAEIQAVEKADVERIAQAIRHQMALAGGVTPQAPSVADEIAKLAALRDAGALSQDEFEAAKARSLGGM